MNSLSSLTILAHGAAQEIFDRHAPLWRRIVDADKICVVFPSDDPVRCKFESYGIGRSGHHTEDSIVRLRGILGGCSRNQGFHAICEYDSFFLAPPPRHLKKGLTGPLAPNTEPCRFMAPRYPNPPWILDSNSASRMLEAANSWPEVFEEGFADRWLAAIAMLANVPMFDHEPPGFTRGTIGAQDFKDLDDAIMWGSNAIHGVKDSEALDFVQKSYAEHRLKSA